MRRSVLLVLAGIATLAGCADTEDGGLDATEAMVLATCAPLADPVETEVCECAYEELRTRFDAEALDRLDRQLRDDPDTVPPEVQEVVLGCGFERVSPPTTKPPTTATSTTGSTTTTTRPAPSTTTTTDRSP